MNKVTLMSPAGSYESLMAALQAGADAVYFGIEQLNMRAKSSNNFTLTDLKKIRGICAQKKVKTYLALNTVLYDHDISLMKKIISAAKASKIDAIIASDQAVMGYAKKVGIPVHISTQANVSNIDTVRFYAEYADTIVLARELTLKQIAAIVKQIKRYGIKGPSGELIKIEVFAHGALCMAVSGKCYLSLHSNNASANRGACVQNCRRQYTVKDKESGFELEIDNEYIMSAQDLSTIDFMDKLIQTGVDILKIEGRGRSADYVYTTTQCYREAIDAYYNGAYGKTSDISAWKEKLGTVFNRGFWGGYYLGQKMGEWADEGGSKASKRKIYVGKGTKYYNLKKAAEFKLESSGLCVGDEILISGPTTGIIQTNVNELRVKNTLVQEVKKGDVFTMLLDKKVRPSDKIYKIVNDTHHSAEE